MLIRSQARTQGGRLTCRWCGRETNMMHHLKHMARTRPEGLDHSSACWAVGEIERLTIENWQLRGALGYPVPGDIPVGNFKCGLCDARRNERKDPGEFARDYDAMVAKVNRATDQEIENACANVVQNNTSLKGYDDKTTALQRLKYSDEY